MASLVPLTMDDVWQMLAVSDAGRSVMTIIAPRGRRDRRSSSTPWPMSWLVLVPRSPHTEPGDAIRPPSLPRPSRQLAGPRQEPGRPLSVLGRRFSVIAPLYAAAEASSPITGIAHVAGIFDLVSLAETTLEQFERIHRVNTTGTFLLLREAARRMAEGGSVVTVTSNAARVPRSGMAAYGSSKAAATQLTRIAGLELAERGIRANVVCPGSTVTSMQRGMWGDDPEGGRRAVLSGDPAAHRIGIPLGRIAEPQDVAEVVSFLLSERARHVTLQEIFVDGGASLGP